MDRYWQYCFPPVITLAVLLILSELWFSSNKVPSAKLLAKYLEKGQKGVWVCRTLTDSLNSNIGLTMQSVGYVHHTISMHILVVLKLLNIGYYYSVFLDTQDMFPFDLATRQKCNNNTSCWIRSARLKSSLVCPSLVWSGPVQSGSVRSGLVWPGLVW